MGKRTMLRDVVPRKPKNGQAYGSLAAEICKQADDLGPWAHSFSTPLPIGPAGRTDLLANCVPVSDKGRKYGKRAR